LSAPLRPGAVAVLGFGLGVEGLPVRARPHDGARVVRVVGMGDVLLVVARVGRGTVLVAGPGGTLGWCALLEREVVA